MKDGIIGATGCMLLSITAIDNASAWVTFICSCLITFTSCGIQVYRMIRDRNRDKKERKEREKKEAQMEADEVLKLAKEFEIFKEQ